MAYGGAWTIKTPPPHPHNDTPRPAPKNRLSTRQKWVPIFVFGLTGWSAFGRFVFAPWVTGLFSTNPELLWVQLVWLGWFVLLGLTALAWSLTGRVRERFASGR